MSFAKKLRKSGDKPVAVIGKQGVPPMEIGKQGVNNSIGTTLVNHWLWLPGGYMRVMIGKEYEMPVLIDIYCNPVRPLRPLY